MKWCKNNKSEIFVCDINTKGNKAPMLKHRGIPESQNATLLI